MFPEARAHAVDELRVGLTAEFEREISEEDVLEFARLSGDYNALHVDSGYAVATNYEGRIVHGAFQVGLASAMLGMYLPGAKVLFGAVNARFPAPLYFPSRVVVRGEIVSWNRANLGGNLKVVVLEASRRTPTAEIYMSFTLHEARAEQRTAVTEQAATDASRAVLITGAAGGIGAAIALDLARDHVVIGMTRRELPEALRAHGNIRELQTDLAIPSWESDAAALLGGRPLHGIVHAAWPGLPRGGILEAQDDVLEQQLAFGTTYMVRLARFLFANATAEGGGSFVALGSTAGTQKPMLSLGAYSLAKAALEQTVKLLAPELARKSITINAVSPTFVPTGMNRQTNERQRKLEASRVPLGRLCTPEDVAGMVRYLLSDQASFVSGQIIGLSGGQL